MSKEEEVKISHRAKKRIKDVKKKARPGIWILRQQFNECN